MPSTQKTFIPSRKQLHRLSCIVAFFKQNTKVTLDKILEHLQNTEYDAGESLTCGAKTVYRDLQILREAYQCPIEYIDSEHSYVLNEKQWELPIPALLNDTELMAAVVGARLLHSILPKDIAKRIHDAVNGLCDSNTSTTLTFDRLESLQILSTEPTVVTNKHFQAVFDAWSRCCNLDITYRDTHGNKSERVIAPHALVYYRVSWYILAYCHKAKARRMFTISRLLKACVLETTFTPCHTIIDSFSPDELLVFATVLDIAISLTPTGFKFAQKYQLHPKQQLAKQKDGTYLLTARVAAEKDAVSWIMQQCGEAVPLEPDNLVRAVKLAAQKLAALP